MPTVGVPKDEDGGKAVHAMLNHFQSLVNDTANKAKVGGGGGGRGLEGERLLASGPRLIAVTSVLGNT